MTIVPILRSGLILLPQALSRFGALWGDVYPVAVDGNDRVSGFVPHDGHYVVVENNLATGRTLRAVVEHLRARFPGARVTTFGTARTEVGKRLLDICLNAGESLLDRYLVAIVGFSGSGKSLVAHLFRGFNCPVYKWAKYLPGDPGRYGEALAELEARDPYALPRHFVHASGILEETARIVVLDGTKDWAQVQFVSFVTRRPAFVVWTEWSDEGTRQRIVAARGDGDDHFDEERRRLFAERLESLRSRAMFRVVLDGDLADLFHLYDLIGLEPAGRVVRQPWASKAQVLDWALYEARKGRVTFPTWREVPTTGSYARKLARMGLTDPFWAEHVETIRRGFKVLDDVLDEDEHRDGQPALWREIGLIPAVGTGIAYLQQAAVQAKERGLFDRYLRMLEEVADAVRAEVEVEEGRAKPTPDLWLRVARREAAFREYLAELAGRPPGVGYLDGLRAQMIDDVLGLDKEGRRGREREVGRPLFQDFFGGVDVRTVSTALRRFAPASREEAVTIFKEVICGR